MTVILDNTGKPLSKNRLVLFQQALCNVLNTRNMHLGFQKDGNSIKVLMLVVVNRNQFECSVNVGNQAIYNSEVDLDQLAGQVAQALLKSFVSEALLNV